MMRHLQVGEQRTLLILSLVDKNIVLASRNIPYATVTLVDQVNTYDLLHAKKLLISESALEKLTQNLLSQPTV